jgi:hypothetical protein
MWTHPHLNKTPIMKPKEYTFKEGFTIKLRRTPDEVVFAMGETHVCEITAFDLYQGKEFIETYDTFGEAKDAGVEISLENA